MVYFKEGVSWDVSQSLSMDAIWPILIAADVVYGSRGHDVWVTSLMDGAHMEGSKHYVGEAVDLRTRMLGSFEKQQVAAELQQLLGNDFDVVLESTHIHVEWDEK